MQALLGTALLVLPLRAEPCARAQQDKPAERSAAVLVPGTRVRLAPPAGHQPGRGFLGYQWPESGASLIVAEMPGPFVDTAAGLDAKGLAQRGMRLLEASDARIAGRAGRLLLVTQEVQGVRFRKWLAMTGDAKSTLMLNAVFPEALEGGLPAALKEALLAAEWDPTLEVDPVRSAPLDAHASRRAALRRQPGHDAALHGGREIVQEDAPASARLLVGPSMGEVEVADAQAFAERRLKQPPLGKSVEIESSAALVIAGRPGWEVVAKAREEDQELLVHQVLIFGDGEYHGFVSQCGRDRRDTGLPRFRACTGSWRLEEPTKAR